MIYHNQIVTCKRGFECTKKIPSEIVEREIETITLSPDGTYLFPECVECDIGTPDDCSILIMPDDNGVFHKVKLCIVKLRNPDDPVFDLNEISEYEKTIATAEAMQHQGGSFVKLLGSALLAADPINTMKIISTFGEYYTEYRKIAEHHNWYRDE